MIRIGIWLWAAVAVGLQTDGTTSLINQANLAYDAKNYAKCADLNEKAVMAGAGTLAAYNAACCHALAGNADDAFTWLDKAVDAGWRDVDHVKSDADLASLHGDERWPELIERCEKAAEQFARSLREPALRNELLQRLEEDQRIRMAPNPDMAQWDRIDTDNTAYMKTVIDRYGWPGKSMVGEDGALAAFLLVQHADKDHAFQQRCLPLLEAAARAAEASAVHLAYLTDRVLIAQGKPQRYGSQFHTVNGKSIPLPLEDAEHVDVRRRAVGLPPLSEYAKRMQSIQDQMEENLAQSVKEPALRKELIRRQQQTQRVSETEDAAQLSKVDEDNAAFLKTVIEEHGWPGAEMVGWDGAQAATAMLFRADLDLEFQRKCVSLLEAAVHAGQAPAETLALLTDRMLVAAGKPQRYGTQFHRVDAEMVPFPIEDPDNLDARRQSLGLTTMAEYTKQTRSLHRSAGRGE